ncbi:hypothetical protein BKA58DRAFT_453237 [Alternaria rosae]|uniref:uncharacterized protein n=1 Tax=Alternaria rosae TaxID=1187941 RepID=UPI001E8EAD56|nr:uncharacterized protein BKA58DRAFT_453237 [Alternaria rosae]KAH6879018.1 hypothetical protein BKA58DRAFT_453237 [Alternaria rosae]
MASSSPTPSPTTAQVRPKPGLLLVHPRLHDPTPSNATTFLRWTKLHFRDLLDMPDTGSGHVTQDLRFVAPEGDEAYTHNKEEEGEGKEMLPKYLYTCLVNDIACLKGEAYAAVSRQLNLEKTRALGEGEVGVGFQEEQGKEKMVFDIVDAKFAVYEEVGGGGGGGGEMSFQRLPPHLTSRMGAAPKSVLIAVYGDVSLEVGVDRDTVPQILHDSLLARFKAVVPPTLTPYSSLYKWAGVEAQPDNHPLIGKDGRGEWMVLLLLVDETGETLVRGHAVMLVEGWVEEERGKMGVGGIEFGVWEGEVFMG